MLEHSNPIQSGDWKSAFRNAFHPANWVLLGLFSIYFLSVAAARPVLYSKLSDRLKDVRYDPEMAHIPRDLDVLGPASSGETEVKNRQVKGIALMGSEIESGLLFLFPGESVLPSDSVFGYMAVVLMNKEGYIKPGFLQSIKDNQMFFDYTGTGNIGHTGGSQLPSQILKTRIVICNRGTDPAFILIGKNVLLIDLFFFHIPILRTWERELLPRYTDGKSGKMFIK